MPLTEVLPQRVVPCSPADFDALSSEMIARGHAFRVRLWGSSMHPTIRNGDVVVIQPCEATKLRRGDIPFCRRGGGHVAHRLVYMDQGRSTLVTRGDANAYRDPPAGVDQLIGRVVAVERDGHVVHLITWHQRLLGLARFIKRDWANRLRSRLRRLRRYR